MQAEYIKNLLEAVVTLNNLTKEESFETFKLVLNGKLSDAQIASLLTSLKIKGEDVQEIAGAALAMRESALHTHIREDLRSTLIDTCGTGGDYKGTFNISTTASLIAAGAGVRIAKHGNYAVSSKSGSANVLKELGVNISLEPERVIESIEKANIGFLFAQKFHSAMKYAAPVRQELGFKTIFNILGPLTNPFGAERQVIGVYSKDLCLKIVEVLNILNSKRAFVVHGRDGIDEISLSDKTDIYELKDGAVKYLEFNPEEYGFKLYSENEFKSDSSSANAKIILEILNGEPGPKTDIAVLNAGFAILVSGLSNTIDESISEARKSIESGSALRSLKRLIEISNK